MLETRRRTMEDRTARVTGAAGVPTTVDRLRAALDGRGIQVFAEIDHAAGARAAGLDLADEVVVVFGAPLVGTPLMQADPRVGIELPLRMLVRDDDGTTIIEYEDPHALAERYALAPVRATLDGMATLLRTLADEIAG
jgi:uncharacterized protein (DUF302 family)